MLTGEDQSLIINNEIRLPSHRVKPDLILGLDQFQLLKLRYEFDLPSGLSVYNSSFGRILCGRTELVSVAIDNYDGIVATAVEVEDSELHELVQRFFSSEGVELSTTKTEAQRLEDAQALKIFKQSVRYVLTENPGPNDPPGRYSVRLPWRDEECQLPDNFGLTMGRLRSALRRLRQKPELLRDYDQTMKSQIELNVL